MPKRIQRNANITRFIYAVDTLFNFYNHTMQYLRDTAKLYNDVLISVTASQISSLMIVYSTVYSGVDQKNIKAPRYWPLWGEFTGER